MKNYFNFLTLLFASILCLNASAQDYTFKQVHVGGGGWVTGVIVHPTEANLVYCRTDVGGVYRWHESTKDWEQLILADRMPAALMNYKDHQGEGVERSTMYDVEGFAIDPSNPNLVIKKIQVFF